MSATPEQAAPSFDPAAAHPDLVTLRDAVLRRDWPAVAGFFDRLTDPEDREYAVRIVSEVDGCEDFLGGIATPLARTLHAARLVVAGWAVRTSARAQYVSREQFDAFHDHLRRAERILIELTAEDPGNTTAWVTRLLTARGLELGLNEARRRYDRLSRHTPHLYAAQTAMVQQLARKWGGSHEQAHGFALSCMRAAPPGSLSPLALVEAHVEQWLDLPDGEDAGYFARPDVRTEVDEAADRSVRHPDFRPGYHWVTAHSLFALVMSLGGDHAAAAPHFRALGNLASGSFWRYLNEPEKAFAEFRAKALAKG